MLKIYINNEEVVANQNFTINKHMLNTPSVILNNVCPKSWCENKDYSNFYHPQDYSKCKIQDETYIPAEPGIYTTINGSATIQNVDTSKLQEVTQLDGNTTQSGTPTPTSPQPINVVSGRQDINVVGKNLFSLENIVNNGAGRTTYEIQDDNIIITATSSGTYRFVYKQIDNLTIGQEYTIKIGSHNDTSTNKIAQWGVVNSQGNYYVYVRNLKDYQQLTFTPTETSATFRAGYLGNSCNQGDILTIGKIQLEKGNASSYEAYTGQSYEINLGKNLLEPSKIHSDTNYYIVSYENNTRYRIQGLQNGNKVPFQNLNIPTGDYTISITLVSGTYSGGNLVIQNTSNTTIGEITIGALNEKKTLTVSNKNIGRFILWNTQTFDATFDIQIEKGSVASSFSAYKTPIELCKIGTNQDHIFKAINGDSVYDNLSQETKDTLTYGSWYIEKQIGKVVLNGSESWEKLGSSIASGTNRFRTPFTAISGQASNIIVLSNIFKGMSWNDLYMYNTSIQYGIAIITEGNYLQIRIPNTDASDVVPFKTWLSTHNTEVYYVLATPTYTEITDSELISQLEAVSLINGLNNVSISSPYLTAPITIHYNFVNEETIIDLLFCGVVKNSGKISLNPREPHLTTLQILDFKDFLSSGETLDYVIYQKTILEAIQQVINSISDYGFVLGNINILNPNEVIGAYSTKDKTAYDVFNYIADITQSRWTARMVDENTVAIDFYDPTLMTQGTAIDYTQSYFENNLIDDMKYNYGTNNYRNKQIMVSNQVIGNLAQIQTLYSNGYQDQYIVDLPIAQIDSIYVDGEKKEVATEEDKYLGINADFYYSVNSNVIESEKIYTASSKIEINYVPVIEGRQVITNNDEISRINTSTGRKGIVSRYEQRNDATTLLELQKIGESYIKYKGTPEIVLTIDSRKNLWEVGQRVQFNAPVDELDTEYMVRTKKINYIVSVDTLFYTYELVSSFNSETEINYFDNQRAKSKGNIGDGEYISRNIDIENVANVIFYDTTATEITLTGDNTLNSILNSPFID